MKIKLLRRIVIKTLSILFIPFKNFIPKSNIVILGTSSRYRYKDNTRYLIEYLNLKGMENLYWVTDSREIEEHLDQLGIGYIGWKSPLKMIWISLRAKIVIDSGNKFFNPFDILNSNKTIKITTMHGNGPKVAISRFHPPDNHKIGLQQIENMYAFDYANYPSPYSSSKVGKRVHLLPNKKIISLGYPRCDQYFDSYYVESRYKEKKIANSLCPLLKENSKIILYTPTWRPYSYEFPLTLMKDCDFKALDKWLQSKNVFLFFSMHSAVKPANIPVSLKHIINIDSDLPFYDTNEFMLEVDVLLNDYSTTSTDFAILNRPQLFFMPDYDYYYEDCGFVEDYKQLLPGKEVRSQDELIKGLEYIFSQKDNYLDSHKDKKKELLEKYYDINQRNSSENFHSFITEVLDT